MVRFLCICINALIDFLISQTRKREKTREKQQNNDYHKLILKLFEKGVDKRKKHDIMIKVQKNETIGGIKSCLHLWQKLMK